MKCSDTIQPVPSGRAATDHDLVDAGKGEPPARFIWFRLPGILGGEAAPPHWVLEAKARDEILLTQPDSAESIRVVLDP